MSVLSTIWGIMKFFDQVVFLVKLLQGSTEEKRQEIMERIRKESEHFEETGRPKWD